MTITRRALAFATLAVSACGAPARQRDEAAIVALMRAQWDRADAPLAAGPVVVAGDYAVADWTQGQAGGRALLVRRAGAWQVTLCAGDALRTAEGLTALGVDAGAAAHLARDLQAIERDLPAERLQRMAAFTEIVRMDAP